MHKVYRKSIPNITICFRSIYNHPDLPPNEPPTNLNDPEIRRILQLNINNVKQNCEDVPIVIGGKEFRNHDVKYQVSPYDHQRRIAKFYYADESLIENGIENALINKDKWENMSYDSRSRIIRRASSLIATKYRYKSLAICMVGQAKTAQQADIDCIAELIDFLRFNIRYGSTILEGPPLHQVEHVINSVKMRALEGFVAAISPFNFSAIGANLASAPVLMGNVVLWKPSDTAILSNYHFFKVLQEAGLPDGVIQFIPSDGPTFGKVITNHPELAGITFTGSSKTFKSIWKRVGENIDKYRTFPKLVGECGGKNFHFVHKTADIDSVVYGTIRSAFEYSGQKCSACSRLYVPDSLWPKIKEKLITEISKLKLSAADDFSSFLSAVIDQQSFNKIKTFIDHARGLKNHTIIIGGKCDDSIGFYIEPTLIQTTDPNSKLLSEEIFGPVCTVYVYPSEEIDTTLDLVNSTSPYGLTGSIFSQDRMFIDHARKRLLHAAGNLYINDRCTGSVVAQQPFGGARASGTNDKAGMATYLQKWTSPQAIKEMCAPLPYWSYPYMSK
ncbi:delta-1-pyrroline-5-carboxylate dehydrogenase, mitochondrial isoform X1 [Hydra vulgaris]|uniref:Multifunctional fusion protein n=1 Tax=Hydra vulgaris TaxID=6087 RepID=T2MGU6_HYDVU|nr:delta-1-pyrroline-5-carboxylate dehydrogenase, mitochondrial [Hydra vulgaris]